jgi:hypothetical protein
MLAAGGAAKAGLSVLGIIELIVIASWILLFAVMLIYLAVLLASRRRGQRRAPAAKPVNPASRRSAVRPAGLDVLRRADPHFDEQMLLDAAQTAALLVFAALSTGDEAPIRRLVTDSFWETPFGSLTEMTARDRRRENAQAAKDAAAGRRGTSRWNVPLDYHPSVPEITAVGLGTEQAISVRISYAQLQAVVRPGASDFAAGAAAASFASAMTSIGKAVAAQAGSVRVDGVSWLAAGGRYDLTFVRPGQARTDPSAALADRTCTTCGATYMSELATECEHCRAARPMPWGHWRLAAATPVR